MLFTKNTYYYCIQPFFLPQKLFFEQFSKPQRKMNLLLVPGKNFFNSTCYILASPYYYLTAFLVYLYLTKKRTQPKSYLQKTFDCVQGQ